MKCEDCGKQIENRQRLERKVGGRWITESTQYGCRHCKWLSHPIPAAEDPELAKEGVA